jgi:hypothetical protein
MTFFQRNEEPTEGPKATRRQKEALRSREAHAKVAEIGEIAPCANPERRKACRLDLFLYLTCYFPESTGLTPFSEDHRRVIARIQRCILEGGRWIAAVYRGFAKSTITENSAL